MEAKTQEQIGAMRQGGKLLAEVLKLVAENAVPDISTVELADIASKEIKRLGAEPAFLGYQDFPSVICLSVNEAVVHGIPTATKLVMGDLLGIDFGVRYRGLITDAAITVIVGGHTSPRVENLVKVTKEALEIGIKKVRDGVQVGDISQAIEQSLRASDLGIIERLVGHGVGKKLHEPPEIPNFGQAGTGPRLKTGMTVAIEPMATLGGKGIYIDKDGWTVKTSDGSLAAHFEHTVLINQEGAEILTQL